MQAFKVTLLFRSYNDFYCELIAQNLYKPKITKVNQPVLKIVFLNIIRLQKKFKHELRYTLVDGIQYM